MIFEMLVGRVTPSKGETFAEICGPLRQMDYVPRSRPNMARKFGILNFSRKLLTMALNRKLLVFWVQINLKKSNLDKKWLNNGQKKHAHIWACILFLTIIRP